MPSFGISRIVTPSAFASAGGTASRPGGASRRRRWCGRAAGCSPRRGPCEHQIFVPLTTQPPSTFFALVRIAPSTSVPPPGSVKPIGRTSRARRRSRAGALLLLLGAVEADRLAAGERGDAPHPGQAGRATATAPRQDHLGHDVAALAAVLLGQRRCPWNPASENLSHSVERELVLVAPRARAPTPSAPPCPPSRARSCGTGPARSVSSKSTVMSSRLGVAPTRRRPQAGDVAGRRAVSPSPVRPSSTRSWSRSRNFWILVADIGHSVTKRTWRGTLKRAMPPWQYSTTLVVGQRRAGRELDEGGRHLAVPRVGNADDLRELDAGVRRQVGLDLERTRRSRRRP